MSLRRSAETSIVLGDETIDLRLDFNAISDIEAMTGGNMLEGLASPRGSDLRAIVSACATAYDLARDNEPRWEMRQIGAMMAPEDVPAVLAAIAELRGVAMPDPEDVEGNPPAALGAADPESD